MTKEYIAAILKEIRLAAGITQKDAAERLGKKQQTVASWESGQSQPDANTLFILCSLYGTTVDEAFGFKKEKANITNKDIEFINNYNALDLHGQATVSYIMGKEAQRLNTLLEKDQSLADIQAQLTAKDSKITELEASLNNAPKKPERKDPESEKINQIPFKSNDEPTDEDIDLLIARNGKPLSNKDKKRLIMLMSEIE